MNELLSAASKRRQISDRHYDTRTSSRPRHRRSEEQASGDAPGKQKSVDGAELSAAQTVHVLQQAEAAPTPSGEPYMHTGGRGTCCRRSAQRGGWQEASLQGGLTPSQTLSRAFSPLTVHENHRHPPFTGEGTGIGRKGHLPQATERASEGQPRDLNQCRLPWEPDSPPPETASKEKNERSAYNNALSRPPWGCLLLNLDTGQWGEQLTRKAGVRPGRIPISLQMCHILHCSKTGTQLCTGLSQINTHKYFARNSLSLGL